MKSLQLSETHRAAGAILVHDAARGLELPSRFGDAVAEQRSIAEAAGLIDTTWQGVVDVAGENAAKVLHGIFSSRVSELAVGEGQPSALLTAKGRIVALFHLFRLEDGCFRLVLTEPVRPEVVQQIERYVTFSDLEVTNREADTALLSLQGPKADDALKRAGWSGPASEAPLCLVEGDLAGAKVAAYRGGSTPEGGFRLLVPRPALEEVWQHLVQATRIEGGSPVGDDAHEALRIEAGRVRYRRDYDDESFPNEVLWEYALTYDKCYVGQEIVSRMKTYGDVHRRLRGLRLPAQAVIEAGNDVRVGDDHGGHVTSAAWSGRLGVALALALIKRKHWDASVVEVESPRGRVEAEVVGLPFVPLRAEWTEPGPVSRP